MRAKSLVFAVCSKICFSQLNTWIEFETTSCRERGLESTTRFHSLQPQLQVEYYIEYDDDEPDEKYYNPNPWKSTGHTWQPPTKPSPPSPPGFTFPSTAPKPTGPAPFQPSQLSPGPPLVPPPAPYHLQKEEPKSEPFQLAKNPAYKPAIPKPFRAFGDDAPAAPAAPVAPVAPSVPSAGYEPIGGYEEPDAGHRDSPAFKPSTEINKEFKDDADIPLAPPPPPPPIPTLSNWTTPVTKPYSDPYAEERETAKKKLNLEELEKVRLYGKKSMHNVVSPQVCFSLSDDLRNMKGKGGKLFAKRRARAEQWVVEDKGGSLPGPNSEIRAKILHKTAMEQALNSPPTPPDKGPDRVDYSADRLKDLIRTTKSSVSPWEAAAGGNMEAAFDHLRYNTVPLRGKKGSGSTSLIDLTGIGSTHFTSSNPAAADAAPQYTTATTYHKGRPQASPARPASALPQQEQQQQQQHKLPDYTRKIQPWSASVPSSGPSSEGAVTDWSAVGTGDPFQPGECLSCVSWVSFVVLVFALCVDLQHM